MRNAGLNDRALASMLVASAPNLPTQELILAENGISLNGHKTLVRTSSACTVYNCKLHFYVQLAWPVKIWQQQMFANNLPTRPVKNLHQLLVSP